MAAVEDSQLLPKIAYITQWFAPEPAGPAGWIADALLERGFTLSVLTAIPNYPAGKTYAGYRSWRRTREVYRGSEVTRSPVYPSHDRSPVRRALNYLSFAASASCFGASALKRADVSLVYFSPATAAIPAALSHLLFKTPYALIVQDMWPDAVTQTGMLTSKRALSLVESLLSPFVKHLIDQAAGIVVISPGMRDALITRGVQPSKISVMFNWVDEIKLRPQASSGALRRRLRVQESDLVFMYAGNLGRAQGLDLWVSAIRRTQDLSNVHFAFIGTGTERDEMEASAKDLDRVHFIDPVDMEQISEFAADCDAQIVSLRESPLFRMTIPGKVQACLALENAVLASVTGDAADLLTASGAAIVADPGDVDSIEKAIRQAHTEGRELLRVRGTRGREYYLEFMSEEVGSNILTSVLTGAHAASSNVVKG